MLTSVDVSKLCLILLLPLAVSHDAEETVVKTVRREHDVTRICNKESQTTIVLIICKINTQRDTGGECHLLYRHGENFTQECDPRFSIKKKNQTAFLELTSLTPEDSGNYTCECTNTEGTYIVHISVTVEDTNEAQTSEEKSFSIYLPGVVIILITGVIVGFIYWRKSNGGCLRSGTSGASVPENPNSLDDDEPDQPYTNLQQPSNDSYQTIISVNHQHDNKTRSARSTGTVGVDNKAL
ncbi:unnamed protein product [Oreochromis niloticus]|nr:unnamed protein product [Mustela putorius furo]